MLSISSVACVLLVIIVCFPVSGDDAPLWKLPHLPMDRRFVSLNELDHPATFTPAFANRAEWEARKTELRRQVQVALGLWPMPARPPIKATIWGRIDRDGYTIENVFFASRAGHYVSGNLYRPKGKTAPLPAVLAPHGHWENGRLMERKPEQVDAELKSGAETDPAAAKYPLQARSAMLAKMGCVVFQYDMVGMGDSAPIPHGDGFRDAPAELRLQSSMGLQTWNSIRALDFLSSLPDVDPNRIAVTGESGGGTQTLILCAIDDRPAVAVPVVMVSGNMQGGCVCENASLLRIDTNNIELAALFAPKPLCMIGADDWTSDIETRGYPEIRSIYSLYGAEQNAFAKKFAFPHNINQHSRELTYEWLNKHLKLGATEPIHETRFEPVAPAQLSVFDAKHPRPADAMDVKALRASMSRESDEQMRELAKRPEEFRAVVRGALEVMVHDHLPAEAIVAPGTKRTLQSDGLTVHQRVLMRPGEDQYVPTIELSRSGGSSRIVIWANGCSSIFESDGRTPIAPVQDLLAKGDLVLAADVLLTGQSKPDAGQKLPTVKSETYFAGFRYGYNRTLLADRAHDLLTVIAYAHSRGATEIDLVASDRAAVWSLIACALANGAVHRAAIDIGQFDFNQVHETTNEMFLPGAIRYGGINAIARLCTARIALAHDQSNDLQGLVNSLEK